MATAWFAQTYVGMIKYLKYFLLEIIWNTYNLSIAIHLHKCPPLEHPISSRPIYCLCLKHLLCNPQTREVRSSLKFCLTKRIILDFPKSLVKLEHSSRHPPPPRQRKILTSSLLCQVFDICCVCTADILHDTASYTEKILWKTG